MDVPAHVAFLAGLALAACGRDEPAARTRLLDCAGRLRDVPGAAARPAPLLSEEFEAPPAGWSLITDKKDVLAVDDQALTRTYGRDGGRTFLTLGGSHGALYKMVPVEGDTPYLFRGELRARGVVPAKQPFFGATFWLAEASGSGTASELFTREKRFDRRHPVASAAREEGWVARRVAFRTNPETRTLIVGCLFAIGETLERGEVDFDRVLLERISERELWEFEAAAAVAEAHRGADLPPATDWRARRRIHAMVGTEFRPALLCLPGESLELELDVPAGDPVFRCGLAPWPRFQRAAAEPMTHWLRIDGRELLRANAPLREPAGTDWHDVSVELAPFAGRRVRVELGVDGPLPGVFAAPEVLDRKAPAPGWNVVLVSIDTLRADRVGFLGATSGATPHLDALAREAQVFADATANAPYTLPAHATLLSGQFPSVHGAQDRGQLLSPARSPVLAQLLAASGYRTQAFVAGGFLTPDFGFHAGFDGFSIDDPLRHPGSSYFAEFHGAYPAAGATAGKGVERVRGWLRAHAAEPFFLLLHTYEVHDYDPPPGTTTCAALGCSSTLSDYHQLAFPRRTELLPGTPEDRAHLGHLYDAALRHVDGELGALFADLATLGLAERTLVIVTSDHGEEMFEHGRLQHGKTLYEEVLRIPLLLRVPGLAGAHRAAPAMQVDVAPTILAALGIPLDPRMQGIDLLRASAEPRPLWAEVDDHFVRKSSVRVGGWKLIHGPPGAPVSLPNEREWELYDLGADPREARDLAKLDPARLAELQARFQDLRALLETMGESLGPLEAGGELDERTQRLLDHLGYGGPQGAE